MTSREPTTLGDVIRLITEVLDKDYGLDAAPLLKRAGIDAKRAQVSGSRVSRAAVMRLWDIIYAETGDDTIGLKVGARVRTTTFYALGMAFMTCQNLRDSLHLLCVYTRVIATVPLQLDLVRVPEHTRLEITYSDPDYPLPPLPFDSYIASILGLCRLATQPDFNLAELQLRFADNGRAAAYRELFGAPVVFDQPVNALVFDDASIDAPLPGRSSDVMNAADRVLENYLVALNPDAVSTDVRSLLLKLLPTGKANQDEVSRRLNMSRSTLQRRLRDEETNFKELLDSTRNSLALEYIQDPKVSLAYLTFLLGFSDQSNFSRAFRRWTGQSPKVYREKLGGGLQS